MSGFRLCGEDRSEAASQRNSGLLMHGFTEMCGVFMVPLVGQKCPLADELKKDSLLLGYFRLDTLWLSLISTHTH